ncbi:hypothetical protein F7R01_02540 [Pseudomonas argentinensis]|uniref:Uncharacterized protein n=1 Tax=Phytopseudomonas argentinensis TaxID=289370 RepID=A0A1I3N8C7_9GAMM|nr:hypothetical protein [Pseudomonas argentinensis]KAB0550111.1 hypothetical protein F7R01_02540 [Pseudomonas argentinensis]SFJ05482.1 hypothetical protein SAMN05216602_3668 [Pseudomonas argentinensis]
MSAIDLRLAHAGQEIPEFIWNGHHMQGRGTEGMAIRLLASERAWYISSRISVRCRELIASSTACSSVMAGHAAATASGAFLAKAISSSGMDERVQPFAADRFGDTESVVESGTILSHFE